MSADDFDDIPSLPPVPRAEEDGPDRGLRADYRDDRPQPRQGSGRPRKPGFGFWMAVVYTLLYFAVTQIIAGIGFGILIFGIALIPEFRKDGPDALRLDKFEEWRQGPTGHVATLCLVAATQFTGLALSWLLFRMTVGRSWKRKIALTRGPTATHAVLVLIGLPALLALSAAVEGPIKDYVPSLQDVLNWLGIRIAGLEGTSEQIAKLVGESPWALALFVIGITPALCEEMFCRGFLGQGLSGRYRSWAVVLIVSFLFGCLHGDPQQGLGAMCLGAAIHGSYLATRSLWVPMFVHWANNSIGVIHMHPGLYPVLGPYEQTLNDAPRLFVLSAALLFGAVCFALHQTRCKLAAVNPDLPTWEPAGVSGVELPPPNSGTIVTHDPLSPLSVGLILIGSVAFALVLSLA